ALEALLEGQSPRELGIRGVGIGFGGPVDFFTGRVRLSHHVPGWEGVPLRSLMHQRLGVPVVVDNDANAATLGELHFGAGCGLKDLVYINIGTGIGGGLVLGGRLHRGISTAAGEVGHTIVQPGGPLCTCGHRGCLEALCAGPAIARRARALAHADPRLGAVMTAKAGGNPDQISAEIAFDAAREGDAGGRRVLEETVEYLAIAVGNLLNLLNPQAVVLGGGVAEAGDLLLLPLRERVREYCMEPPYRAARILAAQNGYDAGVLGAVALAMEAEDVSGA
ncbi:MAG: ROK family protein, partial [Armatimonadota bacterium]|nr:ROK family protein [Armatimonadota bacterium]